MSKYFTTVECPLTSRILSIIPLTTWKWKASNFAMKSHFFWPPSLPPTFPSTTPNTIFQHKKLPSISKLAVLKIMTNFRSLFFIQTSPCRRFKSLNLFPRSPCVPKINSGDKYTGYNGGTKIN